MRRGREKLELTHNPKLCDRPAREKVYFKIKHLFSITLCNKATRIGVLKATHFLVYSKRNIGHFQVFIKTRSL